MTYDCSSGVQPFEFCPVEVNDVFPATINLLPEGPAWDAVREDGTVLNQFWRAISAIVGQLNERLCAFVNELYCHSATESIDQWNAEYALGENCDPYGFDLCAKVAAQGGQSCAFFVDLLTQLDWSVECVDLTERDMVVGCFSVGCTGLGPTPVLRNTGSNIGLGSLDSCGFKSVVDHPEPEFWDHAKTRQAACRVPGSNLGFGPDVNEPCCMPVGWYEMPQVTATENPFGSCGPEEVVISFNCPPAPCNPIRFDSCDEAGQFASFGHSHSWLLIVSASKSKAYQNAVQELSSEVPFNVGNMQVGCAPLCAPSNPLAGLICFIDKVKPAHTQVFVEIRE
jgi:hypothetical protein